MGKSGDMNFPQEADATRVVIRPLAERDRMRYYELEAALQGFHHAVLPDTVHEPKLATPEERDFDYERCVAAREIFFACAEVENEVIGYVRAELTRRFETRVWRPARYVKVDEIVVDPRARRRGVGRALMNAATAWAKSKGAQSIELVVYAFNADAIAFYERQGLALLHKTLSLSLSD